MAAERVGTVVVTLRSRTLISEARQTPRVDRRVGTLVQAEPTWEGDWDAMNKKLDQRARQLLDEGYDVELA